MASSTAFYTLFLPHWRQKSIAHPTAHFAFYAESRFAASAGLSIASLAALSIFLSALFFICDNYPESSLDGPRQDLSLPQVSRINRLLYISE